MYQCTKACLLSGLSVPFNFLYTYAEFFVFSDNVHVYALQQTPGQPLYLAMQVDSAKTRTVNRDKVPLTTQLI